MLRRKKTVYIAGTLVFVGYSKRGVEDTEYKLWSLAFTRVLGSIDYYIEGTLFRKGYSKRSVEDATYEVLISHVYTRQYGGLVSRSRHATTR